MHVKHRDALRKQRRLQRQEIQKKVESPLFNEDEDNISFGGGGDDYDLGDEDNDYGEEYVGPADDAAEDGQQKSNVDFDTIDNVFAQSRGTSRFDADAYLDDADYDGHRQTFEELCRAHLRQFARSAEKYAAETQLSRRVGTWQAGLEPMLEEQERRPEFDIHRCGRKILDTAERKLAGRKRLAGGEKKSESKTIDFASVITRDCEDYEVCRFFLSTLMLCNCGNVKMHTAIGDDSFALTESMDTLRLELVDPDFKPPAEGFLVPSAEEC